MPNDDKSHDAVVRKESHDSEITVEVKEEQITRLKSGNAEHYTEEKSKLMKAESERYKICCGDVNPI